MIEAIERSGYRERKTGRGRRRPQQQEEKKIPKKEEEKEPESNTWKGGGVPPPRKIPIGGEGRLVKHDRKEDASHESVR